MKDQVILSKGKHSQRQKQKQFSCKCGKQYGSASAVHTHINSKHQNNKEEYRLAINNPKMDKMEKNNCSAKESFRMKDIDINQLQVDFMQTTDKALKGIYRLMRQQKIQYRDFLLSQDDSDSCQELYYNEQQDDLGTTSILKTSRDKQIHQLVIDLKQVHQIPQIDSLLQNAFQFQVFKIYKFKLTMVKQLIKVFNLDYGSRIQLQLQIIAAINKLKDNEELLDKLRNAQQQMWSQGGQIIKQLQQYYYSWVRLLQEKKLYSRSQ